MPRNWQKSTKTKDGRFTKSFYGRGCAHTLATRPLATVGIFFEDAVMATQNSLELAKQAHAVLSALQLKKDIAGAICNYRVFDAMDRHILNAKKRYERRLMRVGV